MNATDLIKSGRLRDARKQLVEEVKSSPSDSGKRTLLFQVLLFLGEWDKAGHHLDAIAAQAPEKEAGVQVYKDLLTAEKERIEVCQLTRRPSFLPETPPYFETYYTGLEKLFRQDMEGAKAHFEEAVAQRPSISGTLNGKPFAGFSETDTFLAPFLETMVHERYVWVPFESIRELTVPLPKTLFDLIWSRANITTWSGLTMDCCLPVLYPGSYSHEDERVQLGRMTDWIPMGGSFLKGAGQHVFEIGHEDVALLEIREVIFRYGGPEVDDPQTTGEKND